MTARLPDLGASILDAERSTRWVTALVVVLSEDPLRLDLPPVPGPVSGRIEATTMEMLGGLYLIARLEQTGMLRAAELLVENRAALDVRSMEAVEILEELAVDSRDWYEAETRDQIYARVFGIGPAADAPGANADFDGLLLDACSAIVAWDDAARFGPPPASRRHAVRRAVQELRGNLSTRQYGNTLVAARRIASQVRGAYELLRTPGIVALVPGDSMWDVVRAAWGDGEPDIDRLVTLGQSGQQLVGWAASPGAAQGEPTPSAVEAAALWLGAAGFELEAAA